MKTIKTLIMPVLLAFLPLSAELAENQVADHAKWQEVVYVEPETVDWQDTLYPGTKITTIFGKPASVGQVYAIRFKFPAGTIVQPHIHSQDEYMTVISGSLHVGIGTALDLDKTVFLRQGAAVGIPGKVPHFAWTNEETVIQVHAVGARDTVFVHNHQ